VWVALSEPKAMVLTVFTGRQQTGPGDGMFTGGPPRAFGAANTLRLGAKLHVGVIVAEMANQTLTPGQNFSYNLAFGPFVGTGAGIFDEAAVLSPGGVASISQV
jgi:hypothetical protein